MPLHETTFGYLQPTETEFAAMSELRAAAKAYADTIERFVYEGPDKTYLLRKFREVAMWANISVTRNPDGSPRGGSPE